MPPRRKKAAEEELPTVPDDGTAEPSSEAKPKKKRAVRKAKPAPSKSEGKHASLKSVETEMPIERIPAIIPIKSVPPSPAPSARISIEPDIQLGEAEDVWTPLPRKGVDLSTPPKPLLQSKKVPDKDLEDFLAADDDEDTDRRASFRPPVRTGVFRRIALGFAALALLVGVGVAYVVYAQANVTVYPDQAEVKTERLLVVTAEPKEDGDIPGDVVEVTVAGEKTGAPQGSVQTDAIATGSVTLVNETSSDQVLIATTRLLAPNGTLFRLKSRVNVPANDRVTTEVYADQPGASGNLAPTRFKIPGLSAALQERIYAESSVPMTGGVVAVGTVTAADIEKTEAALHAELIAQARQEFDKREGAPWTGHASVAETMSRTVSAEPGETANGVTVRLTLRVRSVDFDRAKAIDAAAKDLERNLAADHELLGVQANAAFFSVDRADPKTKTASLRVELKGQSRVSLESPSFDASKLRGLGLDDVQAYFDAIEGVDRVEVKFRPFWLKRMPLLQDRIEFQIEK